VKRILLPRAQVRARISKWRAAQDTHILDLMRGASIAGILKVLAAILAFGLNVVLGRFLGAEGAGAYFLALATASIAATFGRFGLDSAVLRTVAAHASVGEFSQASAIQRTALGVAFVCSCLMAVVIFLGSDFVAGEVFSDETLAGQIRVMALAVVPLALSVLVSRALLGLSRVRDSLLVFSIIPTAVALGGTVALASSFKVYGAIMAYVIAVCVALVYGWTAWHRALPAGVSGCRPRQSTWPMRDLLTTGAPLLIGALLQLVIQASGTVLLGVWSDNTEVGRYAVAWRTAVLISFVLVAVNAIAQPKFAELYARGEIALLAATAYKATLLMTACAAPALLIFLALPTLVLSAFGNDFAGGAGALQILSVGQFVNVAAGSVGVLLVMTRHERSYRNVQVIAACVVMSLNFMLIPKYGATGAAIAAASALIVQNILFGYFVWRKLGILTFRPRPVIQR